MRKQHSGWRLVSLALSLAALGLLTLKPAQAHRPASVGSPQPNVYIPLVARIPAPNWLQFNFDSRHSGASPLETRITPANVSSLTLLFQVTLPAIADGAPAYLSGVTTPGGVRDLVFLTTRDGRIIARDARSGAPVWAKQVGPGGCLINHNTSRNEPCYTTSSPAIGPVFVIAQRTEAVSRAPIRSGMIFNPP